MIEKFKQNIVVIHNGLDLEKYYYDEKLGINFRNKHNISTSYVIGVSARIDEKKIGNVAFFEPEVLIFPLSGTPP